MRGDERPQRAFHMCIHVFRCESEYSGHRIVFLVQGLMKHVYAVQRQRSKVCSTHSSQVWAGMHAPPLPASLSVSV